MFNTEAILTLSSSYSDNREDFLFLKSTFDLFESYYHSLVEERLYRTLFQSIMIDNDGCLNEYLSTKKMLSNYQANCRMHIKLLNRQAKMQQLPLFYDGPITEDESDDKQLFENVLEFVDSTIRNRQGEYQISASAKFTEPPEAEINFDAVKSLIAVYDKNVNYLNHIHSLLMLSANYHKAVFEEQIILDYFNQSEAKAYYDTVKNYVADRRFENYHNMILGLGTLNLFAESQGTPPVYTGLFRPYPEKYYSEKTVFFLLTTILSLP